MTLCLLGIDWAFRKIGVNEKLVEVVMQMYVRVRMKVIVGNRLMEVFQTMWLHQGSVL